MGRPKKIKVEDTAPNPDTEGCGVPGLFAPQEWDIREEIQGMEAYTEHCREQELQDS